MSYDKFVACAEKIAREKPGITVRVFKDSEKDLFTARFSDGMVILGNPTSLKLTARWGSGHQAQFVPAV